MSKSKHVAAYKPLAGWQMLFVLHPNVFVPNLIVFICQLLSIGLQSCSMSFSCNVSSASLTFFAAFTLALFAIVMGSSTSKPFMQCGETSCHDIFTNCKASLMLIAYQ